MPSWMDKAWYAERLQREARRLSSGAQPEQTICDEPVAEKEGKENHSMCLSRCAVRITSYRRRLLDPDNLAGGCKYFLDCCKYSQLINDDRPQDIILEVRQEKVASKSLERTEIVIEPITSKT